MNEEEYKQAMEKEEIYKLYKGMTLSMQKAVKNVMRTVNGLDIKDDKDEQDRKVGFN